MAGRKRKGFSLIEVLLAVSILVILLSLSLTLSTSRQRSQKSAQALSDELASQLRWARERARARGAPVGVVFPRNPAPACRSAQVYEGEVRARPLHRLNYGGDSECIWLGDDSAAARSDFQPAEWIPANLRDQSWVVFLPDGSHWHQNLWLRKGSLFWVVAGQAGSSTTTRSASCVRLSPSGLVTVHRGLEEVHPLDLPTASQLSSLPTWTAPTAVRPEIVEAVAQPAESSGQPITSEPDTLLPLRVKVRDSDSNRMFCSWRSNLGALSHEGTVPLRWDPAEQLWIGEASWTSRPEQLPDQPIEIQVEVTDDQGQSTQQSISAALPPRTGSPQRILTYAIYVGAGSQVFGGFASLRPDGSGFRFEQRPQRDARLYGLNRAGLMAEIYRFEGELTRVIQDRRGNPVPGTQFPPPDGVPWTEAMSRRADVQGFYPYRYEEYGLEYGFTGNVQRGQSWLSQHGQRLQNWTLNQEWQSLHYPLAGTTALYTQGRYGGGDFSLFELPTAPGSAPRHKGDFSIPPDPNYDRTTCWNAPNGDIYLARRYWEDSRYTGKERWWRVRNELGASVEEFGLREADSNIAQRELAFSPDGRYFATTQSWTLPYKITVYDSQDISHPRHIQAPAGIYLASGVNGYAAAIWKP